MPTKARVVVLPQEIDSPLVVEEIDLPDPDARQVVVKQFASGICHSQLHQMHRKREYPVVLGHESTGVVVKAGSEVNHVKEGDAVILTWVPRDATAAAAPPQNATVEVSSGLAVSENVFTWADYTLADEQFVIKVNPNLKMDVTAVIGCAVITGAGAIVGTAGVREGETVAIFGVGGVGLCAVAAARKVGAAKIIAVDISDEKLDFARRFGATDFINATKEDPIEAIHNLTRREREYSFFGKPVSGADYAFDCIGVKQTMEQIVPACRTGHFGACKGGTGVLVGVPSTKVDLSAIDILLNEKSFVGSFAGSCSPDRDIPTFIQWYEEGQLDLDALVTERYSIDQINEAATALRNGEIAGRAIIKF
ncbi:MAG: zinc-binding dehydrogenase [Proteobacteria bacterium]|nr:zinc-binding dehydrogenase [Pseudomonadota bacterium]